VQVGGVSENLGNNTANQFLPLLSNLCYFQVLDNAMSDPFKPVPSGAFENQPPQQEISQGGFEEPKQQPITQTGYQGTGSEQPPINQTGFQQTYSVLLSDINALKQSLLDAQTQLISAHAVVQKCELDPWYWKGSEGSSESQQHGFQPVDQQKVWFMENDIVSLRDSVNQASYVLQAAGKVVAKDGFGPYQDKGFDPTR